MKRDKILLIVSSIMALISSSLMAATLFVTPTGAGSKDGSSWGNALEGYGGLNGVVASGDIVYFSTGDYIITEQLVATGFAALELHGGYSPSGDTDLVKASEGQTVIAVENDCLSRHLIASNTKLVLTDMAFSNGSLLAKGSYGMSMNLVSCQTAITNCAFIGNTLTNSVSNGFGNNYGGAIYVKNGSLDINGSLFKDNLMSTTPDNNVNHGGGIYSDNAVLSISDTDFINNKIMSTIWSSNGGAICAIKGSVVIDNCNFLTNSLWGNGHSRNEGKGSAIKGENLSTLLVKDSYFAGNWAQCLATPGGTVYLKGSEDSMTSRFERCVFIGNGVNDGDTAYSGSIALIGGYLELENCLVAGTRPGYSKALRHAIEVEDGLLIMKKCTVYDSNGIGVYRDPIYGKIKIYDSIIYGHEGGAVANIDLINYSCIEGGFEGTGNFDSDPLLSTDGFYHPMSTAGHLNGFFEGSEWTIDSVNSPTLDKADPLTDWFSEPQPNNLRANIGYDASTPAASKSGVGDYIGFDTLTVVSLPTTNITLNTCWGRGIIAGLGNGSNADVKLVWDSTDKGTSSIDNWSNVISLGSFGLWEHLAYQITGLQSGNSYSYRFFVANETGTAWSECITFVIPTPPVLKDEAPSHISRYTASLCTTLVDDGNTDCEIIFSYWDESTPNNITEITYEFDIVENSIIRLPIEGLSPLTTYGYSIKVISIAGEDISSGTFTTLATDVPIARYVSPNGAGIQDGSSWENAYAGLLPAVAECIYTGDTIYMAGGEYTQFDPLYGNTHVIIENAKGLTINGGYAGNGTPGELGSAPTVIRSHADAPWRLIKASSSTLNFNNITFKEGKYPVCENTGGAALWLVGCTTTITNCIFDSNQIYFASGEKVFHGGAIYATTSGSLDIYGSYFKDNVVRIVGSQGSARMFGGAISSVACKLKVQNSKFDNNISSAPHNVSVGGAIYAEDAITEISNCEFLTNCVLASATHGYVAHGYGGAIMAFNTPRIQVTDSTFVGNYGIGRLGRGGVVHLMDHDGYGVMTSVFVRCAFDWNGTNLATLANSKAQIGSFHHDSGRLFMTNCLISRSGITGGFATEHTNLGTYIKKWTDEIVTECELVNVTVADCAGTGISQPEGGTASMKILNTISWGNTQGDISNATQVAYSCASESIDGTGNITSDPLLIGAPYYHLLSRSMYITNGWFSGTFNGPKVHITSPCIDAGDPSLDASKEPHPCGKRINIGAYGGTPWTSPTWYNKASIFSIQ